MPIITIDVESDYPQQLQPGTDIYSSSGFLIGTITDSVEQAPEIASQEISRNSVRAAINPGDL